MRIDKIKIMSGEPKFGGENLGPVEELKEETEQPKRESGISRIIGVSLEQEKEIIESLKKPFNLPEEEKTPEQIEIIKNILDKIPNFIKKYRGIPVSLIPEQVHLLNKEDNNEEIQKKVAEGADGFYHVESSSIGILDSKNDLQNAHTFIHEYMHLNSFESLELKEKDKKELATRRMGFQIASHKKNIAFFVDIDEAIIEELAIRFDKEYFKSIHGLSKKVEEREKYVKFLINHSPDRKDEFEGASFIVKEGDEFKVRNQRYEERKKLNKLIQEIYEKNPEEFSSTEEVFTIFAEAVMSGRLLKVARLIEKTCGEGSFRKTKRKYGEGSFRKLGEETKKK